MLTKKSCANLVKSRGFKSCYTNTNMVFSYQNTLYVSGIVFELGRRVREIYEISGALTFYCGMSYKSVWTKAKVR